MQSLFNALWKDETYYRTQWLEFYQFRRNLLKRFFLGVAPFLVALGAVELVNTAFSNKPPQFANIILITFGVASWVFGGHTMFATNWKLLSWDCPRCGERFFQGGGVRNPFARRCRHCGLPRPKKSDLESKC